MKKRYCPYCMTPVQEGEVCVACGLTAGSYQPNQNHLPPGTLLEDRYLIGRVLGEGGFGITYIGCDLKLEMKVAIKEYYPTEKVQRISDVSLAVSVPSQQMEGFFQSGKQRFLQEALIMARMDKQPEIVGVRDFFECNNTAYIVMEYVEGTTFKQLVAQRGGGIPPGELLPLVEPLFGALSNLHEKGLIHRDISPDNLMLEHGSVRLLDFGCARQPEHGDATMTIQLKHGYAPVEQYTNRGQGPWTDVYALAATLYFCLVGKTPPQAMDRTFDDELILPRKLGVDLTEEQEQALIRAMSIKRTRRFATMEEFRAALYRAAPVLEPVRLRLQVRNVLKNSENRGGFSYELVDEAGTVLKTVSSDPQGLAAFSLTFGKETAGCTYRYRIRQVNTGLPHVVYSARSYDLSIHIRVRGGTLAAELQMNGMPLSEEEVFVFENIFRKPRKKKKTWVWAAGAAAAVALAAGLTAPLWLQERQETKTPDLPGEEPSVVVSQPEELDLFDGAAHWAPGEDFLALLEDDAVAAIVLDQPLTLEQETVLSKPLLVTETGCLELLAPLTVSRTGTLQLEGTLKTETTVTLQYGAQLQLQSTARSEGHPLILVEDWFSAMSKADADGLRQTRLDGAMYLEIKNPDGVKIREVTTEEELRAALIAEPVLLTRDVVLTKELCLQGPVYIAEGVTLTTPYFGDVDGSISLVLGEGGQLINHGTFLGSVAAFEGSQAALINYGHFDARTYFDTSTVFLNLGTMDLGSFQQFLDGSRLYNLGQLTIRQDNWCNSRGGDVINLGQMELFGELGLETGAELVNRGTIRVQQNGTLRNRGRISSEALVEIADGGFLQNESLFVLQAGQLLQNQDGGLSNAGVICHSDGASLSLQAPEYAGVIHCVADDWSGGQTVVEVRDPESFQDAIHDDRVRAIALLGSVTMEDSAELTLEKALYIAPEAELSMPGYSILEIKAVVHNAGTLSANVVGPHGAGQLLNNGSLEIRDYLEIGDGKDAASTGLLVNEGVLNLGAGSVMLAGSGTLVNRGEMENLRQLNMSHQSVLVQMADLSLDQAEITIHSGNLITTAPLTMTNCRMETWGNWRTWGDVHIDGSQLDLGGYVESNLSSWCVTGGEGSRMNVYGEVFFYGWDEWAIQLAVPVLNEGRLECHMPMVLTAPMENNGEFHVYRQNLQMTGSGAIHGNQPMEL